MSRGWGEDGDWWSWCTTVLFGTKSEARRVGGRAMLATETESAQGPSEVDIVCNDSSTNSFTR